MLDETVHLNHDGSCFSIKGGAVSVAALTKRIRLLKGEVMKQGACPSAPNKSRCEKRFDVEVCFSTPGGKFSDIIELQAYHTWHKKICYDAFGPADAVNKLLKPVAKHDIKVDPGKCANATNCQKWRGMTICDS